MSLLDPVAGDPLTPEGAFAQAANRQTPFSQYMGQKFVEGWGGNRAVQAGTQALMPAPADYPTDEMRTFGPPGSTLPTTSPRLDKQAYEASPHFREGMPWDEGMTEARASALAAKHDAETYRASVIARYQGYGGLAGFAAGALPGLLDPTNFVPVLGEAAQAAMVARLGTILGHGLTAAGDAAANTAMFEFTNAASARQMGQDFGARDVATDILGNALAGSLFGLGKGWLHDRAATREALLRTGAKGLPRQADAVNLVAAQLEAGEPADVAPVLRSDPVFRVEDVNRGQAPTARLADVGEPLRAGEGAAGIGPRAEPAPPPEPIDTRGAGVRYHGTSAPIEGVDDWHNATLNYYGPTFYTTDAHDIATGYSKKGGKAAAREGRLDPTIYRVDEKQPVKTLDMEGPVPDYLKKSVEDGYERFANGLDGLALSYMEEHPNGSLRGLYDHMRENSRDEGYSASDVQDAFEDWAGLHEDAGYGALRHVGGHLTGNKAHEVTIYLRPGRDLTLTRAEPPVRERPAPRDPLAEARAIAEKGAGVEPHATMAEPVHQRVTPEWSTARPHEPHPSVAEAADRVGKNTPELETYKKDAGLEGYDKPLPGHEPAAEGVTVENYKPKLGRTVEPGEVLTTPGVVVVRHKTPETFAEVTGRSAEEETAAAVTRTVDGRTEIHIGPNFDKLGRAAQFRALAHEEGHVLQRAYGKEATPDILAGMEKLSREARPAYWKAADEGRDVRVGDTRATAKPMGGAELKAYLTSADELFADAWSIAKTRPRDAEKLAPEAMRFFEDRVGPRDAWERNPFARPKAAGIEAPAPGPPPGEPDLPPELLDLEALRRAGELPEGADAALGKAEAAARALEDEAFAAEALVGCVMRHALPAAAAAGARTSLQETLDAMHEARPDLFQGPRTALGRANRFQYRKGRIQMARGGGAVAEVGAGAE